MGEPTGPTPEMPLGHEFRKTLGVQRDYCEVVLEDESDCGQPESAHRAPEPVAAKCQDALLPDGEVCPRCGGKRAPSGVDGGSWVHVGEAPPQPERAEEPQASAPSPEQQLARRRAAREEGFTVQAGVPEQPEAAPSRDAAVLVDSVVDLMLHDDKAAAMKLLQRWGDARDRSAREQAIEGERRPLASRAGYQSRECSPWHRTRGNQRQKDALSQGASLFRKKSDPSSWGAQGLSCVQDAERQGSESIVTEATAERTFVVTQEQLLELLGDAAQDVAEELAEAKAMSRARPGERMEFRLVLQDERVVEITGPPRRRKPARRT